VRLHAAASIGHKENESCESQARFAKRTNEVKTMWLKQYKKNFIGMQAVIALITASVHVAVYRAWEPTLSFFFVLQGATLAGALWASRIKRRLDPHAR
jgi:hypothetical protein